MVSVHWQEPRRRVRHHDAISALSDAGHRVASTLREWRRRSRERAELAALDDRMLKDIGLTRADAEFLANRPFWRE
jgi:uncharacterized protein YjiS (DUF1127 family)